MSSPKHNEMEKEAQMQDFSTLTDAEINRWAAAQCVTPEMVKVWGGINKAIDAFLDHEGEPAKSADATLALCERWGVEIREATNETYDKQWIVGVASDDVGDGLVYTAPTFARALLNAACAARHAKEMADA